ncbi:MAG: lysoplasmalogenase [Turneriella sp.]|nr:lysoplasmalogenase [Turneriella sp.]
MAKIFLRHLYPFAKPLPILFILFLANIRPEPPPWAWFCAILFGLAGDLLLLWPQGFIAGLLSFLLGHICYVFAFAGYPLQQWGFVEIAIVATISLAGFCYLAWALHRKQKTRYAIPIFLYVFATAVLLLFALRTHSYPAFAGALCFALSDFLLAYNKFVRPNPVLEAGVLLTYYPAQWLLAKFFVAF